MTAEHEKYVSLYIYIYYAIYSGGFFLKRIGRALKASDITEAAQRNGHQIKLLKSNID